MELDSIGPNVQVDTLTTNGGQVVAGDEGPADADQIVDKLVLNVALLGDAGHGLRNLAGVHHL